MREESWGNADIFVRGGDLVNEALGSLPRIPSTNAAE